MMIVEYTPKPYSSLCYADPCSTESWDLAVVFCLEAWCLGVQGLGVEGFWGFRGLGFLAFVGFRV